MQKLKKNSIHIARPITVCWPQFGSKKTTLDVSETRLEFNGCYAINNSTICFVDNNEVFVTPYTRKAMDTLWNAGFTEAMFYVPFSNLDYPKQKKTKWYQLLEKAQQSTYTNYEAECMEWCDGRSIGELSEETLENCFRIPRRGVPVRYLNREAIYHPLGSESYLDYSTIDKLGRYCCCNGNVVFVYRDGHTYVARSYTILSELAAAGYQRGELFVPLSSGERITDPYLAERWEQIR